MDVRVRALLLSALVAACQTAAPVAQIERTRVYAAAKPAVWGQIIAFLERNRIAPVRADLARGEIVAERHAFEDAVWADCARAWVSDHSSKNPRPTFAQPVARDLTLRIAVLDAAGRTEVTVDARFTEQQIDPYRNLPFTQPCRSTGVLEGALLTAL